jgi:hypothetical protein
MAYIFQLEVKKNKMKNNNQQEGEVAKTIEKYTSKIPSDVYLWGGLGLLASAVILQAFRQKHAGLMIGQIATPILLMGVYNKLVKQQGHDINEKSVNGKKENAVYSS